MDISFALRQIAAAPIAAAIARIADLAHWEIIANGPLATVTVAITDCQRVHSKRVRGPRDYRSDTASLWQQLAARLAAR